MRDFCGYYKEASENLFIFYTSLIEAGFSNEQAFELVRTCTNNSIIEQLVNNSVNKASANARLNKQIHELNRKGYLNED